MSPCPDFFHALTGWRRFAINDDAAIVGVKLCSVGMATRYDAADPGPAECVPAGTPMHRAPELACSCGYYAYKTRADAEAHGQGTVLARVSVWGRVVEHTRGYRAERIKIEALHVPVDFPHVGAIAHRYSVPVILEQELPLWISVNRSASSSSNPWNYPLAFQALPTAQAGSAIRFGLPPRYQPPSQPPPGPSAKELLAAIDAQTYAQTYATNFAPGMSGTVSFDPPRGWWQLLRARLR